MKYLATAEQTRALDAHAIDTWGIPGTSLMEVASLRVAEWVRDHTDASARVVVVTGAGNNGGDGWAVARWLAAWHRSVAVWSIKPPSHGDALVQYKAAVALGIEQVDALDDATVVVDAVFGTGLSRPVQGAYEAAIHAINGCAAQVVAVDIPSGIHADTGEVMGAAVRAQHTLTFAVVKPGLIQGPGAVHAGDWHVVDIGLGPAIASCHVSGTLAEDADVAALWPRRSRFDHKTRSGHLLVVAGSPAMAGAAVLTCRAALAAGAGLVTLVTPTAAFTRLASLPAEVMVIGHGDDTLGPLGDLDVQRYDAVAAGPGLGELPTASQNGLRDVWRSCALPVVFDADAVACAAGPGQGERVMTPHPGEAARFLGVPIAEVQADRVAAVRRLSEHNRVALLKGPTTLIAREDRLAANPTGHPVLATAGSGDVLTGVIGTLLARGLTAFDAAVVGAYVHGRAGEWLAEQRSQGWAAGDIADAIPQVVEDLIRRG